MKDAKGEIIYVGKASSLQSRVRSYFGAGPLTPKTQNMVARVTDFEFVVTSSEQEALILEMNLIKRFHPQYNISLRDDKSFPYLKISINEKWPRIFITRRLEDDGARYFGPFTNTYSLRETVKALKNIFTFRTCNKTITVNEKKPCLEYHLKRCIGPCIGAVTNEEYIQIVKQVILFLEGKDDIAIKQLRENMERAAEDLNFEKASTFRDQIKSIQSIIEGQRIATMVQGDQDAIAFAQDGDQALAQIFFVRSGKLIGREGFVIQGTEGEDPTRVMTTFVKQFYASSLNIPSLILLQYPVDDLTILRSWLKQKRGRRVDIQVPKKGPKKKFIGNVAENARRGLEQIRIRTLISTRDMTPAMQEIQKELELPSLPVRIEGYDISNIQGSMAVGSMVVMEEGKPKPACYRRFKIKTIDRANDYAMLQEVLRRRFRHIWADKSTRSAWVPVPDLVLIDGGKGQLHAALSVLEESGLNDLPIASIAKEKEEIFTTDRSEPIRLPGNSAGRLMLQHLRDEAHRYALGYHLNVRRKSILTSTLDTVPGIGPKRKKALLRKFGSVQGIKTASIDTIQEVKGISPMLAAKIKEYL